MDTLYNRRPQRLSFFKDTHKLKSECGCGSNTNSIIRNNVPRLSFFNRPINDVGRIDNHTTNDTADIGGGGYNVLGGIWFCNGKTHAYNIVQYFSASNPNLYILTIQSAIQIINGVEVPYYAYMGSGQSGNGEFSTVNNLFIADNNSVPMGLRAAFLNYNNGNYPANGGAPLIVNNNYLPNAYQTIVRLQNNNLQTVYRNPSGTLISHYHNPYVYAIPKSPGQGTTVSAGPFGTTIPLNPNNSDPTFAIEVYNSWIRNYNNTHGTNHPEIECDRIFSGFKPKPFELTPAYDPIQPDPPKPPPPYYPPGDYPWIYPEGTFPG